MNQYDGNVHVIPLDDYQEHFESKNCWCQPEMIERSLETGVEVWSHNRAKDAIQ